MCAGASKNRGARGKAESLTKKKKKQKKKKKMMMMMIVKTKPRGKKKIQGWEHQEYKTNKKREGTVWAEQAAPAAGAQREGV